MLKLKISQKDYTLSSRYYQIKLPLDIEKAENGVSFNRTADLKVVLECVMR